MSNSNYVSVSNTDLNGPAVLKTTLDNENGRYLVISNGGSATTLNATHLLAALQGRLIVDVSATNDLQVGADSAANAKNLQIALGIPNQNDQCVLRILPNSNTVGADVDLANAGGSDNNVHINIAGSDAAGGSVVLFDNGAVTAVGAGGEAIVLVTNVVDTTGSEEIRFTVLQQGGFNSA